jgi:hypothetical protein
MNEGVSLKLLILGGVDNAGKSTTIRYSTKYLGISLGFVEKFLSQRNPSKRILINSTPVYVYCASPQEIAGKDAAKCRKIFRKRIEGREPNALIIMPFNLESKYQQGIEFCLNQIDNQNLKNFTSFVFLDADLNETRGANNEARNKIQELSQRSYLVVGEIKRTISASKDEQGKNFSVYINKQLTS